MYPDGENVADGIQGGPVVMLVADTRTDRTQEEAENPIAPAPDMDEPTSDSPPQSVEKSAPPPELSASVPSLEERVRRLEDIIATLHLAPPSRHNLTTHTETPP